MDGHPKALDNPFLQTFSPKSQPTFAPMQDGMQDGMQGRIPDKSRSSLYLISGHIEYISNYE